jgi:hypothetical protein
VGLFSTFEFEFCILRGLNRGFSNLGQKEETKAEATLFAGETFSVKNATKHNFGISLEGAPKVAFILYRKE